MHVKSQLSMVMTLYCYDKSKLSDEEDDYRANYIVEEDNCHVNDVVEKNKQAKPINQIVRPSISKFKDASGFAHMISFDWVLSHLNSNLTTELGVG